MNEHFLVLDRRDLREIYSRLETESDWHRLSQRVYVLNKTLGKRAGARFILRRDKATLRVCFAAPENLAALVGALREGRGFVQKALAERLERRAGQGCDRRSVPKRLLEGQAALLKEMLSRDLGLFAGADLDSVLLDVAAPGQAGSLVRQVADLLPGAALVLGESGSGKTALLYRLLRQWEALGAKTSGHTPVYICAKHLRFAWGSSTIPWATLPGVEANMVERLEAAFEEGRLALLIDGINENPGCADFTNPGVQAFWRTASRNACVIASSPRFYESHIKVSPLSSIFAAGLSPIALPAWGEGLYRALFERLAAALRKTGGAPLGLLAGCLGRLSIADWQRLSPLPRPTPLTGLGAANFFMSRQGERLPKDEHELMDHLTAFHLRHEGFKGSVLAATETALGLLMRLAWQAHAEGRGGRYACLSTDDAARVIRERYPALEDRKSEVFHFLSQLPYLEYSQESGLFCMNQRFADYLAAKFLTHCFLAGDIKGLKEALQTPWEHPYLSRFYLQGLGGLSRQEKAQFLHVSQGLYEAYRDGGSAPASGAAFGNDLILARLLQPLGFLDLPQAREFLWSVYNEVQEGPELALMSAAIALAWSGEPKALEAYVERILSNPKAAQFNLTWCLFDRRQDRLRSDLESFKPESMGRWETACDWLLNALTRGERDFSSLRPLHAASLCGLLKTLGPGPFLARANAGPGLAPVRMGTVAPAKEPVPPDPRLQERLRLLGRVVAAWRREPPVKGPALKKQIGELAALAGGGKGGEYEKGPEPVS